MTGYAWRLAGPGGCDIYRPGHQVHWIQFNRSMRDPGPVIPVAATVDDDGLVHVAGEGVALVCWHHRPELVRAALERFDGRADWKPRWKLLAAPMESAVGGPSTVFYLAVPGNTRGPCRTTQQVLGSSGTASPSGPGAS